MKPKWYIKMYNSHVLRFNEAFERIRLFRSTNKACNRTVRDFCQKKKRGEGIREENREKVYYESGRANWKGDLFLP